MTLSFVSFDFETANSSRGSACSIGLVKVINGDTTDKLSQIFKPPSSLNYFDDRNIMIHGITPKMVENKGHFVDYWEDFHSFIGGLPLVAHNASFDMSVLRSALLESNVEWPQLEFACTMVMSRNLYNLTSNSLPFVAQAAEVNWDNDRHHDALYDAEICAEIVKSMARRQNSDSLIDLIDSLHLEIGRLRTDGWTTFRSKIQNSRANLSPSKQIKTKDIEVNLDADSNHPIYGKLIVFTGSLYSMTRTDAWKFIAERGAYPQDTVTKDTDILVVGEQDPIKLAPGETQSAKFRKAEQLRLKGQQIEVMTESDFLSFSEPILGSR